MWLWGEDLVGCNNGGHEFQMYGRCGISGGEMVVGMIYFLLKWGVCKTGQLDDVSMLI